MDQETIGALIAHAAKCRVALGAMAAFGLPQEAIVELLEQPDSQRVLARARQLAAPLDADAAVAEACAIVKGA